MSIFVNDLAFDGKFATQERAADSLLSLYSSAKENDIRLVITRTLPLRLVTNDITVHAAIMSSRQAMRALLLGWIAKSGPFLEDDRLETDDDLWWCGEVDVTDQGLGEAARRQAMGEEVASFSSSEGCNSTFDKSPLEIVQGFPEERIASVNVENVWSTDEFARLATKFAREPTSWETFIEEAVRRYPGLRIDLRNAIDALGKHPFNGNVVRRGFALLHILNEITVGINEDGSLGENSMRLITEHFQGKKAWFSDEKPSDENVFWFRDNEVEENVYCSWHGKIKTPQFRIHFQWPIPKGQRYIRVLYFGEKLTKA